MLKRDSIWIVNPLAITAVNGGTTAVLVSSLDAATLALRPFTIVRSRTLIAMRSDQTSAAEDQLLGYGHIVVQDTASAIGITAVPTPITDPNSDFHVYELMAGRFAFITGVGFDSVGLAENRQSDSKAMRKVDFGQDLAVVAETTGASAGTQLIDGGRILIKLH